MNVATDNIILIGSVLLIASIIANKTSYKLGIPTLILFLLVGMLAGSEGVGGIHFDDAKVAQLLGVVALNFILFSGGLDTRWESVRPIAWRAISLSTIGVIITAGIVATFVHLITDFTWIESLLLGSIVSSTDAAAVFSILRSHRIGLKRQLRPTLELESGSNDPMAYVLTVSFTYMLVNPDFNTVRLIIDFLMQMSIGAAAGYVLGRFIVFIINRIELDIEGLYPVLMMALIFFTYSFTHIIHGNGFLAVYIAALVLGNSNFLHKKSIIKFYDGQAWLMQIVMFLTLGLLVFPSELLPLAGTGLLISLLLILIARPLAVFLSLAFFDIKTRDKFFISWVGLRGAVPIVFATYPLLAGVGKANTIFNLVFFISVTSVLIQGTTLKHAGRLLRVTVPKTVRRVSPLDLEIYDTMRSEFVEVILPGNSPVVGKQIVKINLPKAALILLVVRDDKYIQPGGTTVLEEGDKLFLLANNKRVLEQAYGVLGV